MTWEQKRQQSYNYLDEYKDEISEEDYYQIKEVIGSNAIEDMFSDKEDILNMVRISKGEVTAKELIAQYKRKWGVK